MAQRLSVIRRPTQAKAPGRLAINATLPEIISCKSARGRRQMSLVEGRSGLQRAEQGFLLRALALLRGGARDCEPGLARQFLDCLDEVEIVVAHDEADCIAMRAAAKRSEEHTS